MAKKKTCGCGGLGMPIVISEVAFFASLYYLLKILEVQGNLWVHSLVLFVLINISVIACPVMNPDIKKVCK
jgi:hypothetical protein